MSSKEVSFKNSSGNKLSALLELPDKRRPHNYVIFAHCFTCDKNLRTVRNISRAMNNEGFAVLRFDFTGLGESEGEFSETNFSSNVQDLIDAGRFLEEEYEAPTLLIGHSLGGAAAVFAAGKMEAVKALAVIGAPASPQHVTNLFENGIEEIQQKGAATVNIGGRPFKVSKQLLEDLESKNMQEVIKELRKPLIVFHSPQDQIVGIENAEKNYRAAHHPKSYISLDGADHLLTNKSDSTYVGNVIAGWAERYVEIPEIEPPKTHHQVAVSLGNVGFTSEVVAGEHLMIADEPEDAGGNDYGPSPYEFLSAALGTCTAMTLRMYANRKEWDLEKIVVHLDHEKDYPEEGEGEGKDKKISHITRLIELQGDLDDDQQRRLIEIANKCPVHKTLSETPVIKTMLMKPNDKKKS